eukprot:753197-Hanusia_phi.AAC.4
MFLLLHYTILLLLFAVLPHPLSSLPSLLLSSSAISSLRMLPYHGCRTGVTHAQKVFLERLPSGYGTSARVIQPSQRIVPTHVEQYSGRATPNLVLTTPSKPRNRTPASVAPPLPPLDISSMVDKKGVGGQRNKGMMGDQSFQRLTEEGGNVRGIGLEG